MGMYTGLRAKIKLKPEYQEFIEMINNGEAKWEEEFWSYGCNRRAEFIPRGMLAYMPWDDDDPKFDRTITASGVWIFQCSLKNYEGEIEEFFSSVLPEIAEDIIYLEKYYEEWCYSELYGLEDGEVVLVGKGNKYDCDEDGL